MQNPLYQEPFLAGAFRAKVPDTIDGDSGVLTITSAELLALNATPKTLLPAPGAGLILVPVLAQIHKPAGTAYAGIAAGEDLALRYTNGAGSILMSCETTGFMDQATVQERIMSAYRAASGVSDVVPTPNAALVMHMLTGEITTGNSPLYVRIFYRLLNSFPIP